MKLAMRIMFAWREYARERAVMRVKKESLMRQEQSNICVGAFKAWRISLLALREDTLERMVGTIVGRNTMRVAVRNMKNAARASAHHIEFMKICCMSRCRSYLKYRRLLYQLNRRGGKRYFLPLVRKSISLLRMTVHWRNVRDMKELSMKGPCRGMKLHLALKRWHRVARGTAQYRYKMSLMIRREERRIKGGAHWGGGTVVGKRSVEEASFRGIGVGRGPRWKECRMVCGQLTGRREGRKVVKVIRVMGSDYSQTNNISLTKPGTFLDSDDHVKDMDGDSCDLKDGDEDAAYRRNKKRWMLLTRGRWRRMDTLSLGGIKLIYATSAPPPPSSSSPLCPPQPSFTPEHLLPFFSPDTDDLIWESKVVAHVDKYRDKKWIILRAMIKYATIVEMRRAVVRWSRVSLASLFRRRRFILLRCYPVWKALAHQQRFTRAAFLSRMAAFLRREMLYSMWLKIKSYVRDSKLIGIISKKNALCFQKQVMSDWMSLLVYKGRARSALVPLVVWAGNISVKFSFYYWRISISNAVGLDNLALMKASIKIWRNMALATRCYNKNLARRVLLSLRRLLWVRGVLSRALKRSRGVSLLLATRLGHIGKLAMRRSFRIWVTGVGMTLSPCKARENELKPPVSSSSSFRGSRTHLDAYYQGDGWQSEPSTSTSASRRDKSSCKETWTGREGGKDLESTAASSVKHTSPSSSWFVERSKGVEASEAVTYPLNSIRSNFSANEGVDKSGGERSTRRLMQDSCGRYTNMKRDGDTDEDDDAEEEEDMILNSSLSLRYAALLRSKQSLTIQKIRS